MYRVKDLSWWKEELPTEEEMQHCRENADAYVRNAKQSLKPRAI